MRFARLTNEYRVDHFGRSTYPTPTCGRPSARPRRELWARRDAETRPRHL